MGRQDFIAPKEKVKKNAYITFVIDESGSMASVRKETIVGINEQIQQIKKDFADKKDEVNTIVSLIKFNGNVTPVYLHKDIDDLKEITEEDYRPEGMTAMYDAVGFAINKLNERKDIEGETTSSLVIVVSDGEENSSKEFNGQKIADIVKKLNGTKRWTFSYLGANQDLSVVSTHTNIAIGNTATFDSYSSAGVTKAFRTNASALHSYSVSLCASDMSFADTSFYKTSTADDKDTKAATK